MGIWYREFYNTGAGGELAMRDALHDEDPIVSAANRSDIDRRFQEIRGIPEERCVISSEQRRFLERMLGEK